MGTVKTPFGTFSIPKHQTIWDYVCRCLLLVDAESIANVRVASFPAPNAFKRITNIRESKTLQMVFAQITLNLTPHPSPDIGFSSWNAKAPFTTNKNVANERLALGCPNCTHQVAYHSVRHFVSTKPGTWQVAQFCTPLAKFGSACDLGLGLDISLSLCLGVNLDLGLGHAWARAGAGAWAWALVTLTMYFARQASSEIETTHQASKAIKTPNAFRSTCV